MNDGRDLMEQLGNARPAALDAPQDAALRDRVRRAALIRPAPDPRRRRIGLLRRHPAGLALAGAATAAIAVLAVLAGPAGLLGHTSRSISPPPPGSLPSSASVGASMLTAYRAGSNVLHVQSTDTAPDGVHQSDIWWAPQDAAVGQEQRVRTRELVNGAPFYDAETIYVVTPVCASEAQTIAANKAQRAAGEFIMVYYPDRAWSDNAGIVVSCNPNPDRPDIIAGNIQKGSWTVVARREMNGRPVLVLQQQLLRLPPQELWVDAQTFLPLKRIDAQTGAVEADFQFLPPTPANLALVQPPVPPGFARQPQTGPVACTASGCG